MGVIISSLEFPCTTVWKQRVTPRKLGSQRDGLLWGCNGFRRLRRSELGRTSPAVLQTSSTGASGFVATVVVSFSLPHQRLDEGQVVSCRLCLSVSGSFRLSNSGLSGSFCLTNSGRSARTTAWLWYPWRLLKSRQEVYSTCNRQ